MRSNSQLSFLVRAHRGHGSPLRFKLIVTLVAELRPWPPVRLAVAVAAICLLALHGQACAEPVPLPLASDRVAGHIVPLPPEHDAGLGGARLPCAVASDPLAGLPFAATPGPSPAMSRASAADDAGIAAGGARRPAVVEADAGSAPSQIPGSPARRGEVLITELMPNPKALADSEGEWVELRNDSGRPLVLAGCQLGGPSGATSPIEVHVVDQAAPWQPGAYLTLARGPRPGFAPDSVAPLVLRNGGDTLELRCDEQLIDRVIYGGPNGIAVLAGVALSRIQTPLHAPAAGTPLEDAFCYGRTAYGSGDVGTPGQPNDLCPYSDNP